MRTTYALLAVSAALLLAMPASAGVPARLQVYLSAYMSNSVMAQYSYSNFSIGNSSYVIMQQSANSSKYLVVNVTNSYSLLTSNTAINSVLYAFVYRPGTVENLSQVSYLKGAIGNYASYVKTNMSSCAFETGANPPVTNNLTNAVNACETIPVCHKALNQFGAASAFGLGLVNFSIYYGMFNTSTKGYLSALSGINSSNAGATMQRLGSYLPNLTAVQDNIDKNALFSPPPGTSYADCSAAILPSKQPWYCVAVGYCSNINFNTTLLSSISSVQSQLSAQLPTEGEIALYSAASSSSASGLIRSANQARNATSYNEFLSYSYPIYNSTVAQIKKLLNQTNDANLSSALSALQRGFATIKALAYNGSVERENLSFRSLVGNAISEYMLINRNYTKARSLALNDTLSDLAVQLNYRRVPVRLAEISSSLAGIDTSLNTGAENRSSISAATVTLSEIGVELMAFGPPITMAYITKLLSGGFVTAMLSGSNASVPTKLASAPIYAAIEALLIDLAIIAAIYLMTYHRLSRRNRIRRHRKGVSTAWKLLFIGLFALALADAYAAYAYAVSANHFLPYGHFAASLSGSSATYIALNGSASYSNLSVTQCASSLSSELKAQGKSVQTVYLTNYTCVANGQVSALGIDCYDHALSAGVPVIMLSAHGNGIAYMGMYGTVLYASGGSAEGASCPVAALLSRK